MEAAIRHLRDGALPDVPTCATCCVLDNLGVVGGPLILRHGRSQATSVFLVDLTRNLADVANMLKQATLQTAASAPYAPPQQTSPSLCSSPDMEVIDLYSDPWGWLQESTSGRSSLKPSTSLAALRDALLRQTPDPASTAPSSQTPAPPAHPAPSLSPSAPPSSPHPGPTCSEPPPPPPAMPPHPSCPPSAASTESEPKWQDDTGDLGRSGKDSRGGSHKGGADSNRPTGGAAAPTTAPSTASAAAATTGAVTDEGTPGSRSLCVVISCLSTLIQRYGDMQALALLETLQRSPRVSCVLTCLHTDLHPESTLFAVRRLASCTLELSALSPLQTEMAGRAAGAGRRPAGRLDCRTKRRTGRVKVESELYALCPDTATPPLLGDGRPLVPAATRLQFFAVPPFLDLPDPRALVRLHPPPAHPIAAGAGAMAAAAGGPAAAAGGELGNGGGGRSGGVAGQPVGLLCGVSNAEELARAVGGSMRLTLTEEERRAKQAVVLPYQHTGQHRGATAGAYAAGDHVAYLPPAAGGTGPAAGGRGQGALGHILYVRDSASETDSDQDLDEDLDI